MWGVIGSNTEKFVEDNISRDDYVEEEVMKKLEKINQS